MRKRIILCTSIVNGRYPLFAEDETKDRLCTWNLLIKRSFSMPCSQRRLEIALDRYDYRSNVYCITANRCNGSKKNLIHRMKHQQSIFQITNIIRIDPWARICRSFKETRYRFSAWRAGTKPYLSYWPARLHRLAKSIPRNRFLGSINVYKYGLWTLIK